MGCMLISDIRNPRFWSSRRQHISVQDICRFLRSVICRSGLIVSSIQVDGIFTSKVDNLFRNWQNMTGTITQSLGDNSGQTMKMSTFLVTKNAKKYQNINSSGRKTNKNCKYSEQKISNSASNYYIILGC